MLEATYVTLISFMYSIGTPGSPAPQYNGLINARQRIAVDLARSVEPRAHS